MLTKYSLYQVLFGLVSCWCITSSVSNTRKWNSISKKKKKIPCCFRINCFEEDNVCWFCNIVNHGHYKGYWMLIHWSLKKWQPFCRNFQVHFLERKKCLYMYFDSKVTEFVAKDPVIVKKSALVRNILKWIFNRNSYISIQGNAFENATIKMAAILSWPQSANLLAIWCHSLLIRAFVTGSPGAWVDTGLRRGVHTRRVEILLWLYTYSYQGRQQLTHWALGDFNLILGR